MNRKGLLAVFLSLIMMLSLIPATSFADTVVDSGIQFEGGKDHFSYTFKKADADNNGYITVTAPAVEGAKGNITYSWQVSRYSAEIGASFAPVAIDNTGNSCTVPISSATGAYYVVAKDSTGDEAQCQIDVHVDTGFQSPEGNQIVSIKPGDNVILDAQTSNNGDAKLHYIWYRTVYSDNDEPNIIEMENEKSSTLSISSVTEAGFYTCHVWDEYQNSSYIYFIIEVNCDFELEMPRSVNVRPNDSVTLTATVKSKSDPQIRFVWYDLNNETHNIEKISGATGNTVTIKNVTYSRSIDCWAIDEFGNRKSAGTWLNVDADAADRDVANEVANAIQNLSDNITLERESEVQAARAAFEKLTEKQKSFVWNLEILINAEKIISDLKNPSSQGGSSSEGQTNDENHTGSAEIPLGVGDSSLSVSASIIGGEAKIATISKEQLSQLDKNKDLTIDLTGPQISSAPISVATLTKETVENLANSTVSSVKIKLANGTASIDKTTLAAVAAQANGETVQLAISNDAVAQQTMTAEQKETVKNMSSPAVIDAKFLSGGQPIRNFQGGTVTLEVPYASEKPVRAWFVDESGNKERIPCEHRDGVAYLTMRHFSHYVVEEYTLLKNPITVKARNISVKYSKVRTAKRFLAVKKIMTIKNAQGSLNFRKISGNKNFKIDATTGKISIKKGTKKGTYKLKVKVTAGGNDDYKSGTNTVTAKIKIN